MEIRIQKDTSTSLHAQLVTQISMQIASGLVKPGTKLPSIRALAQKLGIHHNTCLAVYRELAEIGLIDLKHGSGARVKVLEVDQPASLPRDTALEALAEFFIAETRQRGYSWERAQAALLAAQEQYGAQNAEIVLVDLHPDILPVFKAEIGQAFNAPIRAVALEDLDPPLEKKSRFIVNRYHFQALREKLALPAKDNRQVQKRVSVFEVGSGMQELGLIRKLPPGSLIVVVSVSTIILRQAEAVIQALRGDEVIVRTMEFGNETLSETAKVAKRAALVFADQCCLPDLSRLNIKNIQPIQTIPQNEIIKLQGLLR